MTEMVCEVMNDPDRVQDEFAAARRAMVEDQIRKRGVSSPRVLEVMLSVPRLIGPDMTESPPGSRPRVPEMWITRACCDCLRYGSA